MPVTDPVRAADREQDLRSENATARANELKVIKEKRRAELREQVDAALAQQQKAAAEARERFAYAVQNAFAAERITFPMWRYRLDDVTPTGDGPHRMAFALPGHNEIAIVMSGDNFTPLGWELAGDLSGRRFETFADVLIAAEVK